MLLERTHRSLATVVLTAAILSLVSPCDAAPLTVAVGPELSFGPTALSGAAHGEQHAVAAAYGGGNFLVVWDDTRAGELVFGSRVGVNGARLDPVGFPIAKRQRGYWPALAWGANAFLVTWRRPDGGVAGMRVDANGSRLDTTEIAIGPAGSSTYFVDVAFDGTNYVVEWQTSSGLHAARVSTSGTVLDPIPVLVAGVPFTTIPRRLACSAGGGCLFLWQAGSTLSGRRLGPTLAPLDAAPLVVGTDAVDANRTPSNLRNGPTVLDGPRVLHDGTSFVAIWTSTSGTRLARIGPGGAVNVLPASLGGSAAGIAFDGAAYRVMTSSGTWRVATDGTVLGGPVARGARADSGFACGPSMCLYAWKTSDAGHDGVSAARIDGAGQWLDGSGLVLGDSAEDQTNGAIAANATGGMISWFQQTGVPYPPSEGAVFAARVPSMGPGNAGVQLSRTIEGTRPRVGTNGTDYLVVWSELMENSSQLLARRLSASGAPLDAAPFVVMQTVSRNGQAPFVLYDGTSYVVFWQGVGRARVTSAGAVLDAPPVPFGFPLEGLAWNGSMYFATFSKGDSSSHTGSYDLYGVRLDATFVPVDTVPLVLSNAANDQGESAVASDGLDFFVAWRDARNAIGAYPSDIYGARVTAAGMVLDPGGIVVGADPVGKQRANRDPVVAWSPSSQRFLVAWTSRDADGFSPEGGSWIRASEVDGTGAVRASGALVASRDAQWPVGLSWMAGSKLLLGYGSFDPRPPYGSIRVHAGIVDLDGTDAGADAGPDAGSLDDAGDAGSPPADAGSPVTDAGSDPDDAGGGGGTSDPHHPSCDCRSSAPRSSSSGSGAPLGVALLISILRRRRHRRERLVLDTHGAVLRGFVASRSSRRLREHD